jgi:uncharacterized protein (DUF885 family)
MLPFRSLLMVSSRALAQFLKIPHSSFLILYSSTIFTEANHTHMSTNRIKFVLWIFVFTALYACKTVPPETVSTDEAFNQYKESFIEDLWKHAPVWASSVGYHKYDSVLIVPDNSSRESDLAFVQAHLDTLGKIDEKSLSDNNRTDYLMIRDQLKSIAWDINSYRAFEWDPSEYNVNGTFAEMLNGSYAPLEERLRNFYLRMKYVPAYYEAAKINIKNPTLEHTQLAIDQNLGGVTVFEDDLKKALDTAKLEEGEKQEILARAAICGDAVKAYADWLKQLDNKEPRSFRLGKDLHSQKFDLDIQSSYTVDAIYNIAVRHKKDLHKKMATLANELWPKYMGNAPQPADSLKLIRAVIDKISLKHVNRDSFQLAIEKQIPELTEFVKQKDLIYLDPSKPLVVRKEPAYMAGVAGASISAPGPYDKNANTYYNVGSLNGWTPERAESYLREYNFYALQILNIHEAIPGHYAQLVYSNQSPSIIKSVLGNGAMVEGWAVYTEIMMLENGYGNNSPEMWLMYYKWNLRVTCNTILDISVHARNMTKEDAMHLLVDEAFQQQAEAEGKWRRVSLTQVQLCSYFTGYWEIFEFREELKKTMGDEFNLKEFHENFLSYGSAPVKYIRQMYNEN